MNLDLEKTNAMTAEDITWDVPIVPEVPVKNIIPAVPNNPTPPVPKVEDKPVDSVNTDPTNPVVEEQKQELPTLEDISYDEQETDVKTPSKIDENLQEAAIRAILLKKVERHGFGITKEQLSELSGDELVDFEEQLDDAIQNARYESTKTANPLIDKLLTIAESGGDINSILNLYKQGNEIVNMNTDTPDGKMQYIRKFYTDVMKMNPDNVQKKLDKLSAEGELDSEIEFIKPTYEHHFNQEQERLVNQAKEAQAKQEEIRTRNQLLFEQKLKARNIPIKEASELLNTAFSKGILKDTKEEIDVLDYKIMQMQANPDTFLDLVMFIHNPEKYKAKILADANSKQTVTSLKKEFDFGLDAERKVPNNNLGVQSAPTKNSKFTFDFNNK